MKVVLFCGGRGLRLRELSPKLPKPMVPVGSEPVLLHLMRYYAHFGHTDFVLCLGYKGDAVRTHFLELGAEPVDAPVRLGATGDAAADAYAGGASGASPSPNGQVPPGQAERMRLGEWSLTFLQTGVDDPIGERLRRARPLLAGEEMFLANYSDDLADAPLDRLVENVRARPEVVGSFISVKPNLSLHCVDVDDSGAVTGVSMLSDRGLLVNGGYFVFRQGIFDVLRPGEELVEEPFARLIERRALVAHEHRGFWGPLDTLKDHQRLEELEATGEAPWKLWERAGSAAVAPGPTPAAAVDEAGAEGDDAAREVSTGA